MDRSVSHSYFDVQRSSVHGYVLVIHVLFLNPDCYYSGGQRVAKVVAAAAAQHLTPITLEVRYMARWGFSDDS